MTCIFWNKEIYGHYYTIYRVVVSVDCLDEFMSIDLDMLDKLEAFRVWLTNPRFHSSNLDFRHLVWLVRWLLRMVSIHDVPCQRSKCWLSVRPGQPKMSPDNQKYWCGCPTDNRLPAEKLNLIYLVPSTDNQKLGRTTRYCNLVVRGTTIYFFLIRTLIHALLFPKESPIFSLPEYGVL